MKTKKERDVLKQDVETVRMLHELTDEDLAQVSGGSGGNKPCVNELTDELIKSGNYLVPINGFVYNKEYYTTNGAAGLMAVFISPTGNKLFIPYDNIL